MKYFLKQVVGREKNVFAKHADAGERQQAGIVSHDGSMQQELLHEQGHVRKRAAD